MSHPTSNSKFVFYRTSEGELETWYNNHATIQIRLDTNESELSEHMRNLKDHGFDNNRSWEIHKKASPYQCGLKCCDLCLPEKVSIIYRSSHQKCSVKKGVLKIFAKFSGRRLSQSLFLNKVAALSPASLLKQRRKHGCFAADFANFLRTPFLQDTSERLLLHLCWFKHFIEKRTELISECCHRNKFYLGNVKK